jgi:Na+-driven multidrug efflux pump
VDKTVDYAYFTRKMFIHSVLPAPLAGIGLALAEIGDTILVGHAIGMDGLAAIGFISPLFLLAAFLVFGLSMGGAVVYSNLMHEGKKEEALGIFNFFLRISAVIGFGILAGGVLFENELLAFLGTHPDDGAVYQMAKSYLFYILLGIPFEILMEVLTAYLRNDGEDTFSTVVQTATGVGNLIISAILLLFFDWGIAGCSFGFFISNAVAVLVSVGLLATRSEGQLALQRHAASFKEAFKGLRLGFSTSSEYIFDAIFSLVVIRLLSDMAGTDGVAVFSIIENLSVLFIFLYEFIGKTSQPFFSMFFAECNFKELHRFFRYALGYALVVGTLSMLLVMVWPQILDLLFGLEDIKDANQAYYAARVFCAGSIFMGVALVLQNYLQSEEDERSAFLVVFMRRLGASLPIALVLAEYGYYVFWLVYPLSEIVTLVVLYFYKRIRGERHVIDPARVYNASFLGRVQDVAEQLDAVEQFALSWGADAHCCNSLRLAMEEICGVMNERAGSLKGDEPVLAQLTVIAQEDGTFKLHLRDNARELNPFQLSDKALQVLPEQTEDIDERALVLHAVKTHVRQYLYRNYHGFNTVTLTV